MNARGRRTQRRLWLGWTRRWTWDALIDQWFIGPGERTQYMPAATSDAEIDIDAADFDGYIATLRAQEPPEGAPDSMTIEVSDGTRIETVRVRGRLAGTWTCIEGKTR